MLQRNLIFRLEFVFTIYDCDIVGRDSDACRNDLSGNDFQSISVMRKALASLFRYTPANVVSEK